MMNEVDKILSHKSPMRSIARIVRIETRSADIPSSNGWCAIIPTDELTVTVSPHIPDETRAEIIADDFAYLESAAFINGNGIDMPRGILSRNLVKDEDWEWGSLGYLTAKLDVPKIADKIIDLIYALSAEYRRKAVFVMNPRTVMAMRKLMDDDGRFPWSDGRSAGDPHLLVGYPVTTMQDMPDIADGGFAIAFGDFSSGYVIADRVGVKDHNGSVTKQIGGDVVNFDAIKLLKFE